ncbi:unnamed protein product [Urochloa humidicola]
MIRDSDGKVLLSAWKFITGLSEAEEVEALACKEGMQCAKEWGARTILETDCASIARLLQKGEGCKSYLKFILEETREAGRSLPEWKVVHTRRERNGAAHELAQLARRTKHAAVWRDSVPVCVEHIIALDCNFSE